MPQRGHMGTIRDEAGAPPRESTHEVGVRYRGCVHEAGAHSPETTTGTGIASIPAPVAFVRMNLRRRPSP